MLTATLVSRHLQLGRARATTNFNGIDAVVGAHRKTLRSGIMLRRRIVGVLAILFIGIAEQARASTIELGTRIAISPTEFALPIEIVDASGLTGWEVSLLYDPTDVQIDTACEPFVDSYCDFLTLFTTEGSFFAAGLGFNVLNPGFVLDDGLGNQAGTLLAAQGLYGGPLPAPSGDGVLAYVRFTVLGDGNSTIRVHEAITTEISATPVPEPATLLLVTLGLPFMTRYRRRH